MPAVFYENSELEIGKDDVFENEDVAELKQWLTEQRETSQEIAVMLGALKLAPGVDANAIARKLGFVNISIGWIEKRLKQLGTAPEDMIDERHRGLLNQYRALEGVVRQHKAKIKALNIELSEARSKLFVYERKDAA